jgi:hypothetical protein
MYQALAAALLLAGAAKAQQRPAAAPQQRYHSKVTVYDLAARSTRVVYQADQVVEAPNWSRDGRFLLINTGGSL